ncbi:MAG: FeS-binding protein [Saprospirales bacterium]|nr:FeS-binding protein [Saprospirales bacterium]
MRTPTSHKTIVQKAGIFLFTTALLVFTASLFFTSFRLDQNAVQTAINNDYHWQFIEPELKPLEGQEYGNVFSFMSAYNAAMYQAQTAVKNDVEGKLGLTTNDGEYWNKVLQDYAVKSSRFAVAKASAGGLLPGNLWLFFALSFGMGILGAFLYILPKLRELPGIKNNGIFHSKLHNRGWLGIALGTWLIAFYILLYFYPEYLVSWTILADPVSKALNGGPASQWFLYGFLYTIAILVMGVRMMIKYRHNPYQLFRTASVMFFQTAFAFLIPQVMQALNMPAHDLKNIWPLDYSFFYEYRLNELINNGTLGLVMLFWGIALIIIGVPLFTFFFGKRWYCSWVCGCGGLAETLGDPFRQLSDKRLKAWKIERYLIHGVLVFAVVMTALVLYTYFSGSSRVLFLDSYTVRGWYGFAIGSIFAGVVGTGFYPLMGNRVWCRFGCPLAAYLGIVQRFRSRFRITVNGGQCISCGNCSTYCEMGIDVRHYAQRGQDVVRASCVGCGICAAVCPRGVLRLENASADVAQRTEQLRVILIKDGKAVLAD